MSREFALEASGGQVIFSGNSIESEKDNRLLLTATRSAVITGNQFTLATDHPTIHLADNADGKGCANVVIANNSFTETRAKCTIQRDPKCTDRIEIDGNVYGGDVFKRTCDSTMTSRTVYEMRIPLCLALVVLSPRVIVPCCKPVGHDRAATAST